ncbi:MAG: hypothetical protein H6731_05660 [Myxococcales bacterium]|nr:MAG: hypothetical protein H6731_05660 [Myxococcales bacterium]
MKIITIYLGMMMISLCGWAVNGEERITVKENVSATSSTRNKTKTLLVKDGYKRKINKKFLTLNPKIKK